MKFKNLIGLSFGQLTVVEQLEDYYTAGGHKNIDGDVFVIVAEIITLFVIHLI